MSAKLEVILKRFDSPDEVREFQRGRFELVTIGGQTIGRATYQPGWRWSVDVGPRVGAQRCHVEHVGLVLQGRATAAFDDGRVWELGPGALFHIPPEPHDSWVGRRRPLRLATPPRCREVRQDAPRNGHLEFMKYIVDVTNARW